MYESIGITMNTAMMLAFLINAVWWVLMTLPLLKNYRQKNFAAPPEHPIKDSFIRLGHTLRDIKKEKKIFLYLLAFFFFIDGVYTIIEMATAYDRASAGASGNTDRSISVCADFFQVFQTV